MRGSGAVPLVLAVLAGLAMLAAGGCVERRSPSESGDVHPPGWNDPASPDFHGLRVRAGGPDACRDCHGADLHGAAGEVVGCFDCHDGAGGHPDGWVRRASPNFHGHAVAAAGPQPCRDCHGAEYTGGWSEVACYSCHGEPPGGHPPGQSGHPRGWLTPGSLAFHGRAVFEQGVNDCTRCHGAGLSGGTSRVACADCHSVVVPPGQ